MMQQIYTYGPITTGFDVYEDFLTYKSGWLAIKIETELWRGHLKNTVSHPPPNKNKNKKDGGKHIGMFV